MQPEGWAIKLTKLLDSSFSDPELRYPVNVSALALEYTRTVFPESPIKKVIGENLDGFEGALVPSPSGRFWGILYDASQRPERARFTVAHEFGHYLLHRNLKPDGFSCGEEEISRRAGQGIEKEADTFAAYLLMPLHDFRRMIDPKSKPDFEKFALVARRYGVSLMATILRWLEFTETRAIFIVSRDNFMLWAKVSEAAYRSGRFFRTRQETIELPHLARCTIGPLDNEAKSGVAHPSGIWFDEPVEEMSMAAEGVDMIFTILHLPNSDRINHSRYRR